MRLRTDERRNRRQRRRLALPPPDMPAGSDPHQQRILAAVRLVGDLGHREIEEIDGFDVHERQSSGNCGGAVYSNAGASLR